MTANAPDPSTQQCRRRTVIRGDDLIHHDVDVGRAFGREVAHVEPARALARLDGDLLRRVDEERKPSSPVHGVDESRPRAAS